jgi:hypothetical protein
MVLGGRAIKHYIIYNNSTFYITGLKVKSTNQNTTVLSIISIGLLIVDFIIVKFFI